MPTQRPTQQPTQPLTGRLTGQSTGSPSILADGVVLLRAPIAADIDQIVHGCRDPQVAAWTSVPVPYDAADARGWLEQHRSDPTWWENPTWAITVPPSRRWAGSIELRLDNAGGADVGYLLTPSARGEGLAERALRLVCAFAFGTLGLEVVTWAAIVGNDASRRTAQRVGFDVPDHAFHGWLVNRGVRHDAWLGTLTPQGLARASRYSDGYRRTPTPTLTPREQQVLVRLTHGEANRDIAISLGISENTVKNHVRSILEKLPARSRSEAVVVGLRLGLTTIDR